MPEVNELPVMEQFYSIQGEGVYAGQAAYFIRIAGCDVGCVWCDVKDSWNAEGYPRISVNELAQNAANHPGNLVIITGGEPAMYDLRMLTEAIHKTGKRAHIETSGAHPITGQWDWICLSPKKFKFPVEGVAQLAHELKVIVFNKSDLQWAQKWGEQVSESCSKLLQPEWDKREEMHPLVVDFVKNNPDWHISLQTHKYLEVD